MMIDLVDGIGMPADDPNVQPRKLSRPLLALYSTTMNKGK